MGIASYIPYRGFRIYPKIKTVSSRDDASGRYWVEHQAAAGYQLVAPDGFPPFPDPDVGTIKAARTHIDGLISARDSLAHTDADRTQQEKFRMYDIHRRTNTGTQPPAVIATIHDLDDAIGLAEKEFVTLPPGSVLTITAVGSTVPVASMAKDPIKGMFHKQIWTGRKLDYAELTGSIEFDATDAVLRMSADAIRRLEDHSESTDEIGRSCVEHDGPFEVDVTDSICSYFGIDDLSDLTEAHLDFVRSRVQPSPRPTPPKTALPGVLWVDPHAGLDRPTELINGVLMGAVTGTTKKFGPFTQPVFVGPLDALAPAVEARTVLVDQIARLTIPGERDEAGGTIPEPSDPGDAQTTLNALILSARSIAQADTSDSLRALVDSAVEGLADYYPRQILKDPESRGALVAEATMGFQRTGNNQIDYQNLCVRLESAIDRQQGADDQDVDTEPAPAP